MSRSLIGDGILLFVTLCWGISFPLIENSVSVVDPAVFVMVRFMLAAMILLPFAIIGRKNHSLAVFKAGLIIGAMNAIVYISQTIGLQTVTAAQAAFITGISVVLVPFILPLFALGKTSKKDIGCSLLCLLGLFLLMGADFSHLNTGMAWVLLCAFFVAVTIVYLQKVSSHLSSLSLPLLAFYQIFFTAVFSAPLTIGKNFQSLLTMDVILAMLFCAIFATSLALLLQTKYQHYTTANRAAMVFCFEPVFGSLFGYLINGETLGWLVLAGGACIFLGVVSSLVKINRRGHIACEN